MVAGIVTGTDSIRKKHLQEFVDCFRGPRVESERFTSLSYDELVRLEE